MTHDELKSELDKGNKLFYHKSLNKLIEFERINILYADENNIIVSCELSDIEPVKSFYDKIKLL